jgi:hypothetical protein
MLNNPRSKNYRWSSDFCVGFRLICLSVFALQGGDGLQHPKQMQYDEDDHDDNQGVNAVAHSGDSGIYTWTESAQQPQY